MDLNEGKDVVLWLLEKSLHLLLRCPTSAGPTCSPFLVEGSCVAKLKGCGLWPQRYLGSNPVSLLPCRVTLVKSFNLSELQFPHMRGIEIMYIFSTGKTSFMYSLYISI